MAKRTISPFTVTITPRGSGSSRTYVIRKRKYIVLRGLVIAVAVLEISLIGSWAWLFARAARTGELETEIALLEEQRSDALRLAAKVQALELEYERLRSVYTYIEGSGAVDPWLPAPDLSDASATAGGLSDTDTTGDLPTRAAELPTEWPLSDPGFLTRAAGFGESDHPGIDIAVASGTYVRAAGKGTVIVVGTDDVYGEHLLIDHGRGVHTQYSHLLTSFVLEGDEVLPREVIALAGTTGLSTAPHLHFEVRVNGENVDPLEFVAAPR